MTKLVMAALMLFTLAIPAFAQFAPCYLPGVGFVANNTLDQCASLAQDYQVQGNWGGHSIQTDANSMVYVDGQAVGRVQNPSGAYGSLLQRCQRGDVAACDLYYRQGDGATRQYDPRMRSRNLGR
jgi:hypothetical protein